MRNALVLACALLLAGLTATPAAAQAPADEQKPQLAGFEDMKAARAALDEIIRAYEAGDIGAIQARLDPAMIGFQRFLDGMRRDTANLKQTRLHLFEANVSAGPDVAMIQAAWETRFFGVASFTPGLFTGRSTFLMHRAKDGWRLAAVSGDNPFSSESGVLATLTVMPSLIPVASLALCPGTFPGLGIELVDPDLAGLASATIEVFSSQGDREVLTLTALSPGRFRPTTFPVPLCGEALPPTPRNGKIEINFLAVPATLTFRYIDANPGANRPPATLMRSVTIR